MFAVKLIVLTGFAVRPFHPIELIISLQRRLGLLALAFRDR